jgi:hypothetical protein
MSVPADDRGSALAEVLLVVALLGAMVVAIAPMETFFLRQLRGPGIPERPVALGPAERRLAADARDAIGTSIEDAATVRFTARGGDRIAWRSTAEGTLRTVEAGGDERSRRLFSGTSLRVVRPARNLLAASLTGPDGRERRIDIWLRHEDRP